MLGEDIQALLEGIVLYAPNKRILKNVWSAGEVISVDVDIVGEGEVLDEVVVEGYDEGGVVVASGLWGLGDLAESGEVEDDGVHEVEVELLLGEGDEVAEDVDVIDHADA